VRRVNIRVKNYKATAYAAIAIAMFAGSPLLRTASAQGTPNWLNYQGRLTSPSGSAVSDGTYTVSFRLFDSPTSATELWSETKSVTTRNGVFNTVLGQATLFPTGLFSKRLFMQIEVSGRVLTPRQELGSVPFAMTALTLPNGTVTTVMIGNASITTAKVADGAITEPKLAAGLSVPVGGVIAWWGDSSTPPAGWKVCDGSAVNDSASSLNGKTVPDLRNRFIRGAAGNVRTSLPTGGRDVINLAHHHDVNPHSHSINGDLAIGTLSSVTHNHRLPNGDYTASENGSGVGNFSGGSFLVMTNGDPNRSQAGLDHNHGGMTGSATPSTTAALTEDQSIVPSYAGLIYIMRVR